MRAARLAVGCVALGLAASWAARGPTAAAQVSAGPACPAPALRSEDIPDASPRAVLDRYWSAGGGSARAKRPTSLVVEGRLARTVLPPPEAAAVFRYRAPASFQWIDAHPRWAHGPTIATAHQGDGWIRGTNLPRDLWDRLGWRPGDPIRDTRFVLRKLGEIALGLLPDVFIDGTGLDVQAAAPVHVEGRRAWRLDLAHDGHALGSVTFWDDTALPARASMRYVSLVTRKEFERTVEFRHYRLVEGLCLPTELRWSPREWFVVTSVLVGAPLPPELFRVPENEDDVKSILTYRPPARR
jgi:hypothetical protein